jgi:hypothetical protein
VPTIWKKRLFRGWLAIALPLSLLFVYLSVSSHYEAARARGYAEEWYQRDLEQERRGLPKGMFSQDPKVEMRESYRWMARAEARRDRFATYAALLVLLLPAGVLALRVGSWIWGVGEPESRSSCASREGDGEGGASKI